MSSLISSTEQTAMLAIFESSFDTWARSITVYKEPLKVPVASSPSTSNNPFGFGEDQQDPQFNFVAPRTGVFMGIIRDTDIDSTKAQAMGMPLAPEIISRILASPVSLKVRADAFTFIEDGPTERIIDNFRGDVYLLNGHACVQTYQGSEYYIYPLRKTS